MFRPAQLICAASLAVAGFLSACQSLPETDFATTYVEEASDPAYEITLRPELNGEGEVEAIAVRSTLSGGLKEGETLLKLSAPVVYVNVEGIADRITELDVRDVSGPVEFTLEEDAAVPGGFPYFRHWTATRAVEFPIEINYRALVQPEGGINGPAFGIRPSKGGISGAGAGFMLVPVNAASDQSVLEWDLTAFGPGAVGVTTFGEGRVTVDGPPAALMQGWLMAGHAGQFPPAEQESHFRAYWLGDFPYDERAEMAYAAKLYDYFTDFFGYLDPAPDYRVFLRQLDTPPYGGATALANSFMMSRGPALPEEMGQTSPRSTIAHELIHMWVGGLRGEHVLTNWFSEGLTSYYEYTLPFRAGELSFEAYVEGLNELSDRFYMNPGREMDAIEVGRIGFSNGDIRHVPYVRGALYFADLDARVREASQNTVTLDDVTREAFELRQSGELELTIEDWADHVRSYTGVNEDMLVRELHRDGGMIYPASSAFGACVRGERARVERGGETFETMRWFPVDGVAPEDCFLSR